MSDRLASTIDRTIKAGAFGAFQLRVALLCAVVTAFDGYDITSAGIATPALADAWHLHPQAFTVTLTWGSVGLFLGAISSGLIGDRFGRKVSLVAVTALFGLFSVLCGLSVSVPMLTVMRFGAGLGLGATIPLAVALVSDYAPSARHSQVVASMVTGFPLGALLGGLAASQIVHRYGWSSIFLIGGIAPLLYVPILAWLLPESIQVLARREGLSGRVRALLAKMRIVLNSAEMAADGPEAPAPVNTVAALFAPRYAPRTALVWIVLALHFLLASLLVSWMPSVFHAEGLSTGQAILATIMFQPGALAGGLLVGWLCDRFGSEITLASAVLVGVLFVLALGLLPTPLVAKMVLIAGIGFGLGGSQASMNALAGAVYPPQFRATGVGWALGAGRLGNIFGPLTGGLMLSVGGSPRAVILSAVAPAMMVMLALMGLRALRRRQRDAPLGPID